MALSEVWRVLSANRNPIADVQTVAFEQQLSSKINLVVKAAIKSLRSDCNCIGSSEDEPGKYAHSSKESYCSPFAGIEDSCCGKVSDNLIDIRSIVVEPPVRANRHCHFR